MTKTLTEQWREGTLPAGEYYVKDSNGVEIDGYYPENSWERGFINHSKYEVEEVLAPVPTYEEYKNMDVEIDKLSDLLTETNNKWTKTIKENKKLKEQLKEANSIITGEIHLVRRKDNEYVCESPEIINYKKKWGVK